MSAAEAAADAIVVGSGATGGAAAMTLCERGLRVLVLDAGPKLSPEVLDAGGARVMARRLWRRFVSRRQVVQAIHPSYWTKDPALYVDDRDNPYSSPGGRRFVWIRGRHVGGRSLTWGGVAVRFSPYELEGVGRAGHAAWPIAYAELVPYYERLERMLRVHGNRDGLPQLPDGEFGPPRPLTGGERWLQRHLEARWPDRRLIISRGVPSDTPPVEGWPTRSSLGSTLLAAAATDRLTLRSAAAVRRVVLAPDGGRAVGVEVVDGDTGALETVSARVVVLCASTIETVRILLNSADSRHPDGLGNDDGLLGRGLMDHPSIVQPFLLPSDVAEERGHPGSGAESFYVPRFSNLDRQDEPFTGGFGLWGGVQRGFLPAPRGLDGRAGVLVAHGEPMPMAENRVELDGGSDRWGVPTVRITYQWGENDRRVLARMRTVIDEVLESAGAAPYPLWGQTRNPVARGVLRATARNLTLPGAYVHEVGGAPMGDEPARSVVNRFGQLWRVPNVVVADGASWPGAGWQSPTLTMMAVASRACDHVADELSRRELR